MRIPFPERISYFYTVLFGAVLGVVQLLEGTDFIFVACCFAYLLVAVAAFNMAGGMVRPAGAYIFFNAVLTLELGIVVKACVGELG